MIGCLPASPPASAQVCWSPFSPSHFLTASADWSVRLWDEAQPRRPLATLALPGARAEVADAAFCPAAATLLAAAAGNSLQVGVGPPHPGDELAWTGQEGIDARFVARRPPPLKHSLQVESACCIRVRICVNCLPLHLRSCGMWSSRCWRPGSWPPGWAGASQPWPSRR